VGTADPEGKFTMHPEFCLNVEVAGAFLKRDIAPLGRAARRIVSVDDARLKENSLQYALSLSNSRKSSLT
jgi:hypothetical protein